MTAKITKSAEDISECQGEMRQNNLICSNDAPWTAVCIVQIKCMPDKLDGLRSLQL